MKVNIEKVLKNNGASPLELVLYSAVGENPSFINYLYTFVRCVLIFLLKHDTYLCAFIKLLGLDEPIKAPPVTSAMIFELRKSIKRNKYFIQVYTKFNQPNENITLHRRTISGNNREFS